MLKGYGPACHCYCDICTCNGWFLSVSHTNCTNISSACGCANSRELCARAALWAQCSPDLRHSDLLGLLQAQEGTEHSWASRKQVPDVYREILSCFVGFSFAISFVSEEDHHICHFARCLLRWCGSVCIGEPPCCWEKLGTGDLKLLFGEQVGSLWGWPSYHVWYHWNTFLLVN